MNTTVKSSQQGATRTAAVLVVLAVIGAAGFAGWWINQNDRSGDTNSSSSQTGLSKEDAQKIADTCKKEINDEDICKFFTSWGDTKQFSVVSTGSSEGTASKSTIKIDGDKSYMMAEGAINYEVITIGTTTYTKAGDTWWKQTAKAGTETPVDAADFKFKAPSSDEIASGKTTYEKQGKEACGDLTCFKYKVVDAGNAATTEYIWFDDKDYKVRKTRSESASGTYNEQVYSYDNVSVAEPSPVKELGPNQYIIPGQTEPVEVPYTGGTGHDGNDGAAQ